MTEMDPDLAYEMEKIFGHGSTDYISEIAQRVHSLNGKKIYGRL